MTDLIVIAVLAAILTTAIRHLCKAKKNGVVCVGCPSGGCGGCCPQAKTKLAGSDCGSFCGCHADTEHECGMDTDCSG